MMTNVELALTAVLVLVIIWYVFNYEGFDVSGRVFVPEGEPRYGLRGDLLHPRSIADYYIRPDSRMRLHSSSGLMYESNFRPGTERINGCKKIGCPAGDGYSKINECWTCGN